MSNLLLRTAVLVLLALAWPAPARADDAGTASPFMSGAGARSLSMGRTGVASSAEASVLFWNPARLSSTTRAEFSAFHSKLFVDGLSTQAGFLTYPTVDAGAFGLAFQRLGSGDIDARDDRNTPLDSTSFSETSVLFGYGYRLPNRLSLGALGRTVQQSAGDLSAIGFGLDLGLAFDGSLGRPDHQWLVGLNLQNVIAPSLQLDAESVTDPRGLRVGVAYRKHAGQSHFGWTLAVEALRNENASTVVGAGAEVGFEDLLFLRGGADDGRLTAGFGVEYKGVIFDYAFLDDPDLPRNDHLSLGVRFGASVDERIAQREERRQSEVAQALEKRIGQREVEAYRTATKEARRAYDAEDYAAAIDLYQRVLLLRPEDATARERVGESRRRVAHEMARDSVASGDLATAVGRYQSILEDWPQDSLVRQELDAVRKRLAAASNRQEQIDDLLRVALSHFTAEEFGAARRSLGEILRLDPDHAVAAELNARVDAMRRARGEQFLQQARDLAAAGSWSSATAALEDARRLLPERRSDFDALATDWKEQRTRGLTRTTQVARTKQPARVEGPLPEGERMIALESEFQNGLRAFQAGDFARATRMWQAVWDEWPAHPKVAEYLVKALLFEGIRMVGEGEYDTALRHCDQVLAIDPDNAKAQRYAENIRVEQRKVQDLRGIAR